MQKSYRPWHPEQTYLLPPSPREWLPKGHFVYFLLDLLPFLSAIEKVLQSTDGRGTRPYNPRMMLGVLTYAYCMGIYSSRAIAKACHEDIAFRVLSGNVQPHFTSFGNFRRDHAAVFKSLFLRILSLCAEVGLTQIGHVALDGTKVLANASKHKAMSYERMKSEVARLQAEIEELVGKAEVTDAAEDKLHGEGAEPVDVPAELQLREQKLKRIQDAVAALEAEAAKERAEQLRERAAQRKRASDDRHPEHGGPAGQDEATLGNRGRTLAVRAPKVRSRTGLRPDQERARLPTLVHARLGEGKIRVDLRAPLPQPAEAVWNDEAGGAGAGLNPGPPGPPNACPTRFHWPQSSAMSS